MDKEKQIYLIMSDVFELTYTSIKIIFFNNLKNKPSTSTRHD